MRRFRHGIRISPERRTSRQIAESVLLDPEQRNRLVGYARSRFGIGATDAEDLLQDTALELLRQRTSVRSPGGFVFAVFRTRCCRFLESHGAPREAPSAAPPVAQPSSVDAEDARVALRVAFRGISTPCRRLLLAYYMEGRSLREAAETMALAYSGVWKTINRCLKKLKECLG